VNIFYVILLGVVQGLAEFLPISSSGHLVILQSLLPGFKQPGILFDVILHFGTLLAVLLYFRKKLLSYLNIKYLLLLVIGTLPAVVVGLLFKDQVEMLFKSVKLVGGALLVTGVFNLMTDRFKISKDQLSNGNALVVGLMQAFAIIPGVSRSGSTIFASSWQGVNKKVGAEFSFLLSIPAVLGANILEIMSNGSAFEGSLTLYLAGFITALISGYLAINLVFKIISLKKFEYFAYYCFLLGIVTILFF
jgi:undecaprenyl-diphosphatase